MTTTELLTPGRPKARIEIIPLIDVIFFLLATFVLFTLSLDRISALQVTLPRTGDGRPEETTVFLQTTEGGMVYWKQGVAGPADLISTTELPSRLAEYTHRVAVPRVFVRGDAKAKFGTAVLVFDQVRAAGIAQVSIETRLSTSGR